MKHKRGLRPIYLFSSAALISGMIVAASPANAMAAGLNPNAQCTPMEIIDVPGTGASNVGLNAEGKHGAFINHYLADKAPAGLRLLTLPYPASAGVMWSVGMTIGQGMPNADTMSYGDSHRTGIETLSNYMAARKAHCPGVKFGLTGYSQGADVAGDVAGKVSAGEIPGVTPDDMVGTILIGDPGRSKFASQGPTPADGLIYSRVPLPPGSRMANGEHLTSGVHEPMRESRPDQANRVGWPGARPWNFKGQEGKVISFCQADDIACSVDEGSLLNRIAIMGNTDMSVAQTLGKVGDFDKSVKKLYNVQNEIKGRWGEIAANNFSNAIPVLDSIFRNHGTDVNDFVTTLAFIHEFCMILLQIQPAEVADGLHSLVNIDIGVIGRFMEEVAAANPENQDLQKAAGVVGIIENGIEIGRNLTGNGCTPVSGTNFAGAPKLFYKCPIGQPVPRRVMENADAVYMDPSMGDNATLTEFDPCQLILRAGDPNAAGGWGKRCDKDTPLGRTFKDPHRDGGTYDIGRFGDKITLRPEINEDGTVNESAQLTNSVTEIIGHGTQIAKVGVAVHNEIERKKAEGAIPPPTLPNIQAEIDRHANNLNNLNNNFHNFINQFRPRANEVNNIEPPLPAPGLDQGTVQFTEGFLKQFYRAVTMVASPAYHLAYGALGPANGAKFYPERNGEYVDAWGARYFLSAFENLNNPTGRPYTGGPSAPGHEANMDDVKRYEKEINAELDAKHANDEDNLYAVVKARLGIGTNIMMSIDDIIMTAPEISNGVRNNDIAASRRALDHIDSLIFNIKEARAKLTPEEFAMIEEAEMNAAKSRAAFDNDDIAEALFPGLFVKFSAQKLKGSIEKSAKANGEGRVVIGESGASASGSASGNASGNISGSVSGNAQGSSSLGNANGSVSSGSSNGGSVSTDIAPGSSGRGSGWGNVGSLGFLGGLFGGGGSSSGNVGSSGGNVGSSGGGSSNAGSSGSSNSGSSGTAWTSSDENTANDDPTDIEINMDEVAAKLQYEDKPEEVAEVVKDVAKKADEDSVKEIKKAAKEKDVAKVAEKVAEVTSKDSNDQNVKDVAEKVVEVAEPVQPAAPAPSDDPNIDVNSGTEEVPAEIPGGVALDDPAVAVEGNDHYDYGKFTSLDFNVLNHLVDPATGIIEGVPGNIKVDVSTNVVYDADTRSIVPGVKMSPADGIIVPSISIATPPPHGSTMNEKREIVDANTGKVIPGLLVEDASNSIVEVKTGAVIPGIGVNPLTNKVEDTALVDESNALPMLRGDLEAKSSEELAKEAAAEDGLEIATGDDGPAEAPGDVDPTKGTDDSEAGDDVKPLEVPENPSDPSEGKVVTSETPEATKPEGAGDSESAKVSDAPTTSEPLTPTEDASTPGEEESVTVDETPLVPDAPVNAADMIRTTPMDNTSYSPIPSYEPIQRSVSSSGYSSPSSSSYSSTSRGVLANTGADVKALGAIAGIATLAGLALIIANKFRRTDSN